MNDIHALIYVSTIVDGVDDAEISRIVEQAQRKNAAVDVTGLLVRCGDLFMQAIEGEADRVESLYARIATDPRHGNVRRVATTDLGERFFAKWSMGFEQVGTHRLEEHTAEHASTLLAPLLKAGHLEHDIVKRAMLERLPANRS